MGHWMGLGEVLVVLRNWLKFSSLRAYWWVKMTINEHLSC